MASKIDNLDSSCFNSTSSRSLKTGRAGKPWVFVHYGETFKVAYGSTFLVKGNIIKNTQFENLDNEFTDDGGNGYIPFLDADAQACRGPLGHPCVKNLILESSPYEFGLKNTVLWAYEVSWRIQALLQESESDEIV
ncbi:hypothetical protein PSHT_12976 [Puccinia striiformis]|uniref:Uncharacterized protein n=1 Tax=Puccinia striiformis TaxID=27350 RepID=A0A2S4UTJ3_9BASI|nr:hypothetical protein PSHT_12976 [Puccinia striiformis]